MRSADIGACSLVYPRARRRPSWRARSTSAATRGRRSARRRGRRARAAGRLGRAIVSTCGADAEGAWAFCRALRKRDARRTPVLLLIGGAQLADLELRDDLFDDFCLTPFHPTELEARLRHLLWRRPAAASPRPSSSSTATCRSTSRRTRRRSPSRPLDLTYMEYELLKFLAQNPGKVFTREMLLSRVWGYEYYGGARTVDVHIRRLRAKLGEEHANLIQTVRSVGYRFGQSRWGS